MNRKPVFKDKLVIKNTLLKTGDYVFIPAFLVLLLIVLTNSYTIYSIIFLIAIAAYSAYRIIKRLKDRSDKIIIDKSGIMICDRNELIGWDKIKFAYIKQKSEGYGKSAQLIHYFHIKTISGEIVIDMRDFKFDKEILRQSVEHFSGRNIGDFADMVSAKLAKKIGNYEKARTIESKITRYIKNSIRIGAIIFFVTFVIAIVLQVLHPFPYIIAIWLAALVFGISIFALYEKKYLKGRLGLSELSDSEFNTLMNDYSAEFDLNLSSRQTIFSYIFLIVIVVAVFIISYLFDISK